MSKIKSFIRNEMYGWKIWEWIWLGIATTIIIGLSLYWGDNLTGIIMAVTGCVCVIMTGKGKMSAYIFGLVNTILYAYIAFGARYYGEVMLNAMYYVPMQFVGWFAWKKHMNDDTGEVEKTKMSHKEQIITLLPSISSIYLYGLLLKFMGGSLPFVDSMSTCLSVLAMILSVKRLMEQWILWIVVDVVTIYMWGVTYFNGGNDIATLIMWIVYLFNAVFMFVKWFKESNTNEVK